VKLTEKHKQIATLAAAGVMKKEIAEQVGVHANTITRTLKRPEVRAMIDEMQKTVQQETITNLVEAFNEAAPAAFRQLTKLMTSGPPSVSLRANESILDRSETAPKRQLHAKHDVGGGIVHLHIGGSKVRELHSIMLEAADDPSEVPEVPMLDDKDEYVVALDRETGEVLPQEGRSR
jgi:sarcosine oxidase gamma subunit